MGLSIQENTKKINTALSIFDSIALGIAALFLAVCAIVLLAKSSHEAVPVSYEPATPNGEVLGDASDNRPFGSINSPVYTFSWCQGSDQIKPENKVYFRDSDEAEQSGRTLSKLCQR